MLELLPRVLCGRIITLNRAVEIRKIGFPWREILWESQDIFLRLKTVSQANADEV